MEGHAARLQPSGGCGRRRAGRSRDRGRRGGRGLHVKSTRVVLVGEGRLVVGGGKISENLKKP